MGFEFQGFRFPRFSAWVIKSAQHPTRTKTRAALAKGSSATMFKKERKFPLRQIIGWFLDPRVGSVCCLVLYALFCIFAMYFKALSAGSAVARPGDTKVIQKYRAVTPRRVIILYL